MNEWVNERIESRWWMSGAWGRGAMYVLHIIVYYYLLQEDERTRCCAERWYKYALVRKNETDE